MTETSGNPQVLILTKMCKTWWTNMHINHETNRANDRLATQGSQQYIFEDLSHFIPPDFYNICK